MTKTLPFVPDDAPFTAEQRAWLNGLLAGLFQVRETQPAATRVAVLYASQSGTAEGLARKIARTLKAHGFAPTVSTLAGYSPAALAAETYALILASTYGDGEAPDGVQPFYEELCLEHFPRYEKLHYAIFALGDRHYEHFCQFGRELDAKLASLGAERLSARVESDVEVDEPFAAWQQAVLTRLEDRVRGASSTVESQKSSAPTETASSLTASPADAQAVSEPEAVASCSRDNPALAALLERKPLTAKNATKLTLHLAFSTEGTGLKYEVGDAFGVIPQNDPELVAEILQALKMNGNEQVTSAKSGAVTLHHALLHELQITRLSRRVVQEYAALGECAKLTTLLLPENKTELERYVYDRGLIDLLAEYPGAVSDAQDLARMLPKLTPRLYSISSSPAAHLGQVHATVAVVRYEAHHRTRGGVCSTLLADRVAVQDRLPVYIQPNRKFRLPQADAPIVMIGPGTGIAPFRGFLHERRVLGAAGRNWLFFGERSAETSFLYREELETMLRDGHLTRLTTAFSRDQEQKVYVQDRMLEQAQELWKWLEDGASVYVCGDATHMAKDVHRALVKVVETAGGKSAEAAEEYIHALKDSHRYHRDVY